MNTSELDELDKDWPEQVFQDLIPFWHRWIDGLPPMADGTINHYVIIGREFCSFAKGKNLTPRLLAEFYRHVITRPSKLTKKPLTSCAASRRMGLVKSFLSWMALMKFIKRDPSPYMPHIRQDPPKAIKLWSHDDYLRLVEFCNDKLEYQLNLWLIILAYNTGMSISDCCLLTWSEVALKIDGPCYIKRIRRKMKARTGARATCVIPIIPGSELWVWFKRMERARGLLYPEDRYQGVEWVNQDAAESYDTKELKRSFYSLFKAVFGVEVAGRSFRNLRNSFCSRMVNSGVDSVLITKMTGHTRLDQLSAYVMPDLRALQDAMRTGMKWVEQHPNSTDVIEPEQPDNVIRPSDHKAI